MQDIQGLGRKLKWQWFEKLTAWVFEQNGFDVSAGTVRIKDGIKRQYDVLAEGHRYVFAVDCKRWTGGRYKSSQLRRAVEMHIERCSLICQEYGKGIIPLIVTLMQEDILIHSGVPVVPIDRLNRFINSWEQSGYEIRQI